MHAIVPTVHEDPRDGLGAETGDYYCKKCVEYGFIEKVEDTYPNPPEENSKRLIPCTICAMANGGRWGWEEGHKGNIKYTLKSNGYFPGSSGIEDVLNGHSTEPYPWWDISDEEVVLGFVQNGLWNHYTWAMIIDQGEGLSRFRPSLPPTSYLKDHDDLNSETNRYKDNWYWWKIIPYDVVLPKRLIKVLKEMLSSYCEKEIPTTRQKPHITCYTEGTWEYFFETYIEPSHVVHMFTKTLEKVIKENKENLEGDSIISNYHVLPYTVPELLDYPYPEQDQTWLMESNNKLDSSREDLRWSDGSSRKHFLISGSGKLFDGYEMRVLRILDRDIFGTHLSGVIEYDWLMKRSWNRDTDILQTYERPPSPDELCELWHVNDWKVLYDDAMKILTYEKTLEELNYNFEDSDYSNEYFIRGIYNIGNDSDIDTESDIELTSDEDSDDEDNPQTKNAIQCLQEIQELVDEEIKENVKENTYLKFQNKFGELYRIIK